MRWIKKILLKIHGFYVQAPTAAWTFTVVLALATAGGIAGSINQDDKPSSAPRGSVAASSPSPASTVVTATPRESETNDALPSMPKVEIKLIQDGIPYPPEGAEVAARLFWLLNMPLTGTTFQKSDVIREASYLTDEYMFQEIQAEYEPPLEAIKWSRIVVYPAKEVEPGVWLFYLNGMDGDRTDAGLYMQVKKEDGQWRVVQISET